MESPGEILADAGWVWRAYQKKLFADHSRLIVVAKGRQIGMSEAAAALAVAEALNNTKRSVWLLSVNVEAGKEVIRKCADWLRIFAHCDLERVLPTVVNERIESIELSNGSRISVLPCAARSVRGKTGTVIWDEAAHAQNDEEVYTAIAPVIASNPHLRLILISTPFGDRGVFYRAFHGKLDGPSLKWSKHRVDVHDAVKAGFPAQVLELRPSYTDDQWAQEFECSFNSQRDRYYQVDLIKKCFAAELEPDEERVIARRVLAIDVASKQDSSIAVVVDDDGEQGFHIHTPIVLSEARARREYPQQFAILKNLIEQGDFWAVAIDANGVGAGLASFLVAEFGSKIISIMPNASWKAKNIPALKVDMQGGHVEIEPLAVLTSAFNAVKEVRTTSNNVVFRAPRDDSGHADGFSAALMGYSVLKRWPDAAAAPAKKAGGKGNQRARLADY